MIKRIIIMSFIFCVCFASTMAQSAYVEEGVGIDGVIINKSSLADVIATYGEDYKIIEHNKYAYEARYKNGLSFFYCFTDTDKKIYSIRVGSPYYGLTSKGIVVGESTVKDVFRLYGESEHYTTGSESWFFEYKGVQFHIKFDSWEDDDDLEKFLERKIIFIDVERTDNGNCCK